MKVIIEAQHAFAPHRRGIPVYSIQIIRNLLARKKNDYALSFFDQYKERGNRKLMDELFGEFNVPFYECNDERYSDLMTFNSAYHNKSYNDYIGADGDIFHFTHVNSIPLKLNGKMVVTVHDLLPLLSPELFTNTHKYQFNLAWERIQEMEPAIIAVSQATKNDVIKLSKLQNIYVVPEGFDESVHYHEEDPEVLTALGIYKTYILYCGALDMRKNIIRILDAFDNIAKEFPEINLVLAGKADANATPMLQKLENHKYKERIITPGFVSDEQKRALMSGATVFLFPSLYEGFGLPVLEAMACGCPVITAGNTSLPEVGGDAVIYIDANNTEQLAYEIERIITSESLRDELRQKGFKQSKMFSWDKAARMTEEVYAAI